MPTYNAADIINHTLIARKTVLLLKPDLYTPIRQVKAGETIGVVNSWVGGGDKPLYWEFQYPGYGTAYVLHETGAFDIDSLNKQLQIDGKSDLDTRAQEAAEQKKKDDMGAFLYYLEKYGKVVLITAVGVVVFREIMRYQTSKSNNKK